MRAPARLRSALLGSGAAGMLLAGCAVGPDFHRPAPPAGAGYTPEPLALRTASGPAPAPQSRDQRFEPGQDIPGNWWALFHSRPLDTLMVRALRHNPSLAAAQAALLQARENTLAQEGAFFPSLTASAQAQRFKVATGSLSSGSAKNLAYYNLYTGQLSVGFVPDVFGLNRRTVESLDALAENQRYQLEATYLTLTANLAAAAVQEALLRAQIDATVRTIDIERQSVDVLRKELALGAVAQQDVLIQEAALSSNEATLPPFEKALAQQRDLVAALVGTSPGEQPAETFTLDALDLPPALPVSLPSSLVEQRPDILAAMETLRSANATIGIAVANRLPQFDLSALVGTSPAHLAGLFGPGNGFLELAGIVTQPLFQGFALVHHQRAAEAATAEAEAQYQQTVVTALQNVADTLRAIQSDAVALETAQRAEGTALASLRIARAQLDLGAVDNLVLLTAEQTELASRLNLVQARANRLADTVALFEALGGGWWHRQDVPKGAAPSLL